MSDVTDTLKNALGDRMKHPILGSFGLFFLFFNKELIYYLLLLGKGGADLEARFDANMKAIENMDFLFIEPLKWFGLYLVLTILSEALIQFVNYSKSKLATSMAYRFPTHELESDFKKREEELTRYAKDLERVILAYQKKEYDLHKETDLVRDQMGRINFSSISYGRDLKKHMTQVFTIESELSGLFTNLKNYQSSFLRSSHGAGDNESYGGIKKSIVQTARKGIGDYIKANGL